jgi:hypothetical protein
VKMKEEKETNRSLRQTEKSFCTLEYLKWDVKKMSMYISLLLCYLLL